MNPYYFCISIPNFENNYSIIFLILYLHYTITFNPYYILTVGTKWLR